MEVPAPSDERVARTEAPATRDGTLDVDAIRRGDREAFEELVRQESPRLYRMIVRIVRDPDEARSVLQETFLQAFRNIGSFRGDARLSTWLYGIGINQARAALRRNRRYETLDEEDIERLQPAFRDGAYADRMRAWNPERVTETAERQRLVREAIDQLPESYRTVVILRDIEELSTSEAARILDVSEGAVRVRLHRARQALRTLLDRHFGENA
ncbi:MAG TPA: sigma-70 family RNA polymerase sigma factor [Rhodothermales bacterium]